MTYSPLPIREWTGQLFYARPLERPATMPPWVSGDIDDLADEDDAAERRGE
jgi:hypothetical protein